MIAARANEVAIAMGRVDQAGDDVNRAPATEDIDNRMKACFMLGGANNEKFVSSYFYLVCILCTEIL